MDLLFEGGVAAGADLEAAEPLVGDAEGRGGDRDWDVEGLSAGPSAWPAGVCWLGWVSVWSPSLSPSRFGWMWGTL